MQACEVSISDESGSLNPAELGEFLFLFPGIGRALSRIVPSGNHSDLRKPTDSELARYRHELGKLSPLQLDSCFYAVGKNDVIQISRIARNSPFEMTLCGCAFLITLAVVFSGGKVTISLKELKAELPSFGKGLKSLREALGLGRPVTAGFGIREIAIELNEREYAELMIQDDASKSKGGFQHFLVELKKRVKKGTKKLRLSPSDLQRIYRYKSNPRKGGWQSRFNKIFGRHFPDDVETLL